MKLEIVNYLTKVYPDLSGTNKLLLEAQANFETGNYTSNLYKNNNNLFGITFIGQKLATGYTTRTSDGYKFAKYNSWQDSVNDRMRIFYALYPHLVKSDDPERIIDSWLYSYLGRNATQSTKDAYKKALYKISGISQKKKINSGNTLLICLILLIAFATTT